MKFSLFCYAIERHFEGYKYKTLIPPLLRSQSRMNTGFINLYCVTENPIIWRGRKRSIRLRPLDYQTAKTETAVKDAKREVYP